MQSVKWVSFCASSKVLKTMLHLFPASTSSPTPYPVTCKISLFGEGKNADTVMLDGVRLNQANCAYLDTVFPALNGDYAGFLGVTVEFSLRQQSVNLDVSSVIIDLLSFSSSTRYYPSIINEDKMSLKSFPVINDISTVTSLVIVNSTLLDFSSNILDANNNCLIKNLEASKLSIKEYELKLPKESDGRGRCEFNSCWTSGILDVLKFENDIPCGVVPYILCRDATSKKIVSCFAL